MQAEWLLAMMDRFKKMPEEILAADSQLLQLLEIEGIGDDGQ